MKNKNMTAEFDFPQLYPFDTGDVLVGYVGVTNVYIAEWQDNVIIFAVDPGGEEAPAGEIHNGTFLGAWRKAAAFVRKHGGTVLNRLPTRPRRPARPDLHVRGTTVDVAPWAEPIEFDSRRKAKRFARRHRREVEDGWSY